MKKPAILIQLSDSYINLLEGHLKENKIISNLINIFSDNITTLSDYVFISSESKFSESPIAKLVNFEYENLPYSHEIKLLKKLFDKNDTVIFFENLFPMFNIEVLNNLLTIHKEYLADYSYGENIPPGLCPVIFQKSIFEMAQQGNEAIPDDLPIPLANYIEKNINKFHVEIHFEQPDLRMLRLDFSARSLRSLSLISKVMARVNLPNKIPNLTEIENILREYPQSLFHFPSYIELELISDCDLSCTFCPRQYMQVESHALGQQELIKVLDFCATGLSDTHIALGGLGEPMLHENFSDFLITIIQRPAIQSVVIETNGLHLEKLIHVFQSIESKLASKVKLVLNLNSLKQYTKLHGENKLEIVLDNLKSLVSYLEKNNLEQLKKSTYLQMLKIEDNEFETDDLFGLADQLGIGFILQKYNSYAGLMTEKRVSDMTPLERSSCWHLRRDLTIRANGDVSFCKQDIQGKNIRGNIKRKPLAEIWKLQEASWIENYSQDFPDNPSCSSCDEYFTFNL